MKCSDRDNEDACNNYHETSHLPRANDAYSVRGFGFFENDGKCYFVDQLRDLCGGFRSDPIETPIFDASPSSVSTRSYNRPGSTDDFQVFQRSCSRGIPYELCLEKSIGTVIDTKGAAHLNDVRPLMMYDPYGRIVRLEFVPVQQYNHKDQVSETNLVVKLAKEGPRGYCLTRNYPYPTKWGARFDNLDGYRNSNLGLYEAPDAQEKRRKHQMEINRQGHLGEKGAGPHFTTSGEKETWVRGNRISTFAVMNDDGLTQRNLENVYEETFSEFATWIDVRHFKPPSDLPKTYFQRDLGVIKIGKDLSCAPGGISTVSGDSTGFSSVTFTDVTCPAYTIIGPVYQHLFVHRLDMVQEMTTLMTQMKDFGKEIVMDVIRKSHQEQRHHWTDFEECFEVDGEWKHVVGPIRDFLKSGGNLANYDAVHSALEGAPVDKIDSLFSMAQELKLQTISDFKNDQGNDYKTLKSRL